MSDTSCIKNAMKEEALPGRDQGLGHTEDGIAYLKQEYIIPIEKAKSLTQNYDASTQNSSSQEGNSFPNKKRRKGKNQNRPWLIKEAPQHKLCRFYWSLLPGETPGPEKCPLEKCCFSHDYKTYLEKKPKSLGDQCHNFSTYGFCRYGLVCRYGSCHIESNGSVVDAKKFESYQKSPPVKNSLKKEVQTSLRKRTYDFSKAKEALTEFDKRTQKPKQAEESNSSKVLHLNTEELLTKSGQEVKNDPEVNDTLTPLRPQEKKKVDWKDKLYLAPLTTLGNLPFRRVCKRLGADITCSEMAVATGLLQGSPSEWALVKRHVSEDCFGVQLCGHNADAMIKCALLLENEVEMDFVDINMGCPIDFIYQQGGGSALLCRKGVLSLMAQGMNRVLSCPLTLKMRTAVYKNTEVAHTVIERAKLWDINLFTVHGRSKEQRYLKLADWDYIDRCAEVAAPIPLFGNGDILTYEDYLHCKNNHKVSGMMLARGALMKPWLFREIKEQRTWDISSSERLDVLKEFVNYGLEQWGSDLEGVEKTRRFLLEWLSFLYRYIPVGILERPQRINQRPSLYVGRDDLETLMASSNVKDWVKISEMLLGPVPDNFAFLPKHKANSWG